MFVQHWLNVLCLMGGRHGNHSDILIHHLEGSAHKLWIELLNLEALKYWSPWSPKGFFNLKSL